MAQNSKQRIDPSVTEVLKELAGSIGKMLAGSADLSTDVPGLSLYRNTAPTAPNPCTYAPSLLLIPQGKKHVELGKQSYVLGESTFLPHIHRASDRQSSIRRQCGEALPCLLPQPLIWAWSVTFSTPRRCGFLHLPLGYGAWFLEKRR